MNNYQDMNAMKTKLILTAALLIAVFSGCKKEKYLAASFGVSNTTETVYTTAARLEATFSYPGTKYVIRVDVSERQDMSEAVHYDVKVNGDKLTAYVTGLKANTTYYYRYSNDTGFGILSSEQKSFKTNDYSVPAVTTAEVSEITGFSVKCGGEVTDDGYLDVTARGVCWGTTQNPTANDSHTSDGTGTGVFTSATTNLEPGTKYYIRAYATNAKGTGYGEVREFTTLDGDSDIYTGPISGITVCSAVCDGSKVTDGGGLDVMDKGLCWAKHPNPTTDDMKVSKGSGLGEFTVEMTGLEVGERYYVRAYSVNTKETKYGNEREFTTMNGIPAVTTSSVTNITATTATCGGEVTDDGGFPVTERGVCWSKSTNPTVEGSHKTGGSGNGSFTVGIDNLEMDETYHVRAYAKNSHTTSYGNDVVFTTLDGDSDIYTGSISGITVCSAVCDGSKVTDGGGLDVMDKGLCWAKHPNPTTDDMKVSKGSGLGEFTVEMTGLEVGERYYVRAYSVNTKETKYGNEREFTTLDGKPIVTTSSVTNVMATTATCGGEVTEDYGFSVTARGVCWSTSPNPTVSDSHTTDGSGIGSFTSSITGLTDNTTYYVRAYATNSKGTSYGEQKSFTTLSGGGGDHEYVDLGLPSGLKWATCNVGAEHPYDYGDYFAWGETTTKSTYDWSTYKWCNGSSQTLTKYCTDSNYGTVDNKTVLDPEDDAAHANWGGGWRMPTTAEWKELYDNTTCTWTTENGVAGRKFTSKADSSKYIFLPSAGYRNGTDVDVAGSYGYYWSSSLYSSPPYDACSMYFYSGNVYPQSYDYRYYGFSVRPVQ